MIRIKVCMRNNQHHFDYYLHDCFVSNVMHSAYASTQCF